MEAFFLRLINSGVVGSLLILALLALRPLLQRGPKWLCCLLWLLALVRMLPIQVSIQSPVSLVPSAAPIPTQIVYAAHPAIDSGIPALDELVNPIVDQSLAPVVGDSANPIQIWLAVGQILWLAGLAVMLLYALLSYLRLRRRVAEAVPLRENIRLCGGIESPFVLGLLLPKIYLPFGLDERTRELVLAHAQGHIRRGDQLGKLFGFLILALHWFNPLLWLAYALLCRDMELACDEAVLRRLGPEVKKDYSRALLRCAARWSFPSACPVAFGETGVRQRIKAVLHYKRPGFWMMLALMLVVLVLCLGLMTDPVRGIHKDPSLVSAVEVFNGNTGESLTVEDPESIRAFCSALDELSLRRGSWSLGYTGYSYRITVRGGGGWSQFILNAPDTVRRDPFFYSVTGGEELYRIVEEWFRVRELSAPFTLPADFDPVEYLLSFSEPTAIHGLQERDDGLPAGRDFAQLVQSRDWTVQLMDYPQALEEAPWPDVKLSRELTLVREDGLQLFIEERGGKLYLYTSVLPPTYDRQILFTCEEDYRDELLSWAAHLELKLAESALRADETEELRERLSAGEQLLRSVSCELPEGLRFGEFDRSMLNLGGLPILNEAGEQVGAFQMLQAGTVFTWEEGQPLPDLHLGNHLRFVEALNPVPGLTDCYDNIMAFERQEEPGGDWTSQLRRCFFWFRPNGRVGYWAWFDSAAQPDAGALLRFAESMEIPEGGFYETYETEIPESLSIYYLNTRLRGEVTLREGEARVSLRAVSEPGGLGVPANWSSSDESILRLFPQEDGSCTVHALGVSLEGVTLTAEYQGVTETLLIYITE